MKKAFVLLLVFILAGVTLTLRASYYYAAASAGGGGFTSKQSQGNDTDSNDFSDGSTTYMSSSFTASSSYSIKKVAVRLKKTGTPAQTIVAEIWTDAATLPVLITGSTSTTTLDTTTVTTSFAAYEFTFPSDIAVTSGTRYHVVLHRTVGTGDGSNNLSWSGNPAGTEVQNRAADPGVSWVQAQASMDGSVILYSSP